MHAWMLNYKGTNFSSVYSMKYYEFEEMTMLLHDHLESQKKEYDKVDSQQKDSQKGFKQPKQPKMPSMPKMNMPKM